MRGIPILKTWTVILVPVYIYGKFFWNREASNKERLRIQKDPVGIYPHAVKKVETGFFFLTLK
jgi:hypothetical protein